MKICIHKDLISAAIGELREEILAKLTALEVRTEYFAKRMADNAEHNVKNVVAEGVRIVMKEEMLKSEQRMYEFLEKEKEGARDRTSWMVMQGVEVNRREFEHGVRLDLIVKGKFPLKRCVICRKKGPEYGAACGHAAYCAPCALKQVGTERPKIVGPQGEEVAPLRCPMCNFSCEGVEIFHFLGEPAPAPTKESDSDSD